MQDVKTGDVFYAYNKYMLPKPKVKYHLCVSKNKYFLINTKRGFYTQEITPEDCSIIQYTCYVNLTTVRTEPIKDFKIIKKEELSKSYIKILIEKIKIIPSIPDIQKNEILSEFYKCL